MPSTLSNISKLLAECEEVGTAPKYVVGGGEDPLVLHRDGGGREVIVVSDLHIAAGLDADGRYGGTENFFSDEAFSRFVDYVRSDVGERGGILIINGDFLDFLRIVELPDSSQAFEEWSEMLAEVDIQKSSVELAKEIDNRREREFGMKTHDYRSVWRLRRSIKGHPELFAALATWLADGTNQLVILKGNHDLEWYWLAVRNALRLEFAKMIVGESGGDLELVLRQIVLPNLIFIDDALLIDTDFYVEHGHRYDKFTVVLGEPAEVFNKKSGERELNIPFGSFFNRYLLNRLEGTYPYIDNVRPRQNILPLLIRERFPLALKIIFYHVGFLYKVLRKNWRYVRFMFGRVFFLFAAIAIPLGVIIFLFAARWSEVFGVIFSPRQTPTSLKDNLVNGLLESLKYIGGLILSYFLARLVAQLQLSEPSSLEKDARRIIKNIDYRFVTMGHTHNPDQFQVDGRWFYNTGTWIPIVEASSAEVRRDRMYCFLHLKRDEETGRLEHSPLQQWDDSAGRPVRWPIVVKK
ncbi:MAG: hypothetical protein AB7H80_16875 [Candidatus Kapaibacterium sp.]